jgi:hypothetical protein
LEFHDGDLGFVWHHNMPHPIQSSRRRRQALGPRFASAGVKFDAIMTATRDGRLALLANEPIKDHRHVRDESLRPQLP